VRQMDGRSYTILRLGTVFGSSPRMRLDLMVNTMTHRAVSKGVITVMGGQAWRPHVHCRDVANAFFLATEAPGEKVNGEIFNVGSDANNFTISEVAVMVASEVPGSRIEYVDTVEDLRSYRVSFEKIRHVLGFAARYRVEDGIREVRTLIERKDIDGEDERYSNLRYLKTHGFRRPRPDGTVDVGDVPISVAS
jgi:nucleoside-diphosphate-sugar epimerase